MHFGNTLSLISLSTHCSALLCITTPCPIPSLQLLWWHAAEIQGDQHGITQGSIQHTVTLPAAPRCLHRLWKDREVTMRTQRLYHADIFHERDFLIATEGLENL